MNMKKWIIVGAAIFLAYMAYLVGSDGSFLANFIVYICLFIIAGHGWNLLGGYIGEISFGHAVFWGIGAYAVGLPIGYGLKIPLLLLVLLGAVAAAVFAWLISYPLLRVQGFPFLVGTYGLGVVFEKIFIASPALFATRGIFIPHMNKFFLYGLIFALTVAVTIFVKWLVNQDMGLRFKAVRDVPGAAQMIGINIYRTKATALIIGAFLTGLAGGFYALYSCFVNPGGSFGMATSIAILLGPYIGGVGTVLGTVFGSTIVICLQEWARSAITVSGGHHLLLGLLLIVIMMTSKEGLYPGLKKLFDKIVKKGSKKPKINRDSANPGNGRGE